MEKARSHILVCAGAGCVASGSLEVSAALTEALAQAGLADEVKVVETGCLGPCVVGPVAVVYPDGVFYQGLSPADAPEIVEEHLLKGRVVERLVHKAASTAQAVPALDDIGFFRKQQKIVLRNCGVIDPLRIEEYIARDGYQALAKVLTSMSPDEVIETVRRSGLRGRGGAGFPTGLKWRIAQRAKGERKFVLCNADEGDPGAFMDRSVLEGDPHSVIEAMAVAAYAIGSAQGYVYVRAEYPLAVKRLGVAIEQARDYGLLGQDILGAGFNFDIEIRMGSGAFVCGEETALMTSIEGHRGEPRPRPPYPANQGLWGMPSLLNNVETYANIPQIILRGDAWYAAMGTEKSKGTKVFALAGAVNNTGLVEVPIGMPLGEIVYDIGGGIPNGKRFKAAQIGGPSGGCVPREHLNVPVDYETLTELGAIMGSGGLIVMDEDTCMVDIARFFLDFVQDESCGKCPPCRIGTKRMLEIVDRICEGRGEEGDVERLIELGQKIKDTALCGLGQTAPNPVLSTIRHFRNEYDAHIRQKRCPAGVCAALVRAPCENACPAGVNVPGYVSLLAEGRYDEALKLHRERNPFAAVSARVCIHLCEGKCRRASLDEPLALRSLKRFLVEQEDGAQLPEVRENAENARRRVAIVGAGPAGLSCAYFLARLGYRPTVFEAEAKPGGMLVQAIPAYRLPRDVIEREVRMIERMGVEIRTGVRLGRDISLAGLRAEGYEAVFLGVGAPTGSRLGIPGDDAAGVTEAIRFLREYNLAVNAKGRRTNGKRKSSPADVAAPAVGRQVVVVGGGNAAIDAARTALRLGARTVTVLYRRTRAEMPAYAEEIAEAEREGVRLVVLAAPIEVVTQDGRVTGLRCRRMALGPFDRSGRRRPEPAPDGPDNPFTIEADQVIAAVGQTLEASDLLGGTPVHVSSRGYLVADPITGQTSVPWVFAGGDAVLGPASVVEAVGQAEAAAVAIDTFLTGAEHAFWRDAPEVETDFDPDADPVPYGRAKVRTISLARRKTSFDEVELPWGETVAVREARRCLRCDYRVET
jgi:NADH-quinone oxidoreductase subunit F